MEAYLDYLRSVERKAENTVLAYSKDIRAYGRFLMERNGKSLDDCADSDAAAYMMELNKQKKSRATINRKLSSLRAFYDYKVGAGVLEHNPFADIKAMRNDVRSIDFLTVEEVEALLALPDNSPKGLRDRAIMEFMYGSGIRVSELIRMKYSDLNLRMRFISCRDIKDSSRIIPLGSYAYNALMDYIFGTYKPMLDREIEADDPLFINMRGEAITRQAVWRLLKEYGSRLGIEERMTPQILRDSFAVHILQNGGDLRTLQELMGFDDLSAGLAYLGCIEIRIKDVYNRTHPRA